MQNFISEIKRINTDGLIYTLSEISIDMFKKNQHLRDVEIPVLRYGRPKKLIVQLSAWDIPNIEFLSVKHSNDYRHSEKKSSIAHLINLYREYENEHSAAKNIQESDINGVFRIILGMTAEQFLYQNLYWIFEKFNRDYYILLAAKNFEHRSQIDTNAIVRDVFGLSADDYIAVLIIVLWLCSQHPDPLSAPENLYRKKEIALFTKENISNLIQYYSCSYKDLRSSPLRKQLLYTKPFIKTQRYGTYLSSSFFLVAMTVANGLYWIVRDYYFKQGSQKFLNAFGLLFEDYIKELASIYCKTEEWKVLAPGKQKGADFIFNFGTIQMIIEAKTSLLRLDAKQQVPNLASTDAFFKNIVKESYEQLQSSYSQLTHHSLVPIIKVILLYDEFSNTAIIEQSSSEIFERDPLCFVMTIREFEILLYLHHNDNRKCSKVLNTLLWQIKNGESRKNIGAIYNELSIFSNPHLEGKMDFFSRLMKHFGKNLW